MNDLGRVLTADLCGPLPPGDIEPLAADARLTCVTVRADEPQETWVGLNEHLFARRGDVKLIVDTLFADRADLAFLRRLPKVRRLCVSSGSPQVISSLDAIALPDALESLSIGSSSLTSFDVLDRLPPHHLRELHLADTGSHKPSLRPVARFTGLKRLHLTGHTADIAAIRGLRSLESLQLQVVRLDDLDLLLTLPELVSFSFAQGGVRDAAALAELRRLKHLNLYQVRGINSLDFLAGMRRLQWLELSNLPKVQAFPNLSRLVGLRRVSLGNLKRLERLDGLAAAPALDEYLHTHVGTLPPEAFLGLLDHPALRHFTAIYGGKKENGAIRELASRKGKLPTAFGTNPFVFKP